MGVLGAFFGCSGDGGFNGCCSGACSGDGGFNGCCSGACSGDGGFMLACISGCRGVIGFNVATSQLPVREKVRPACSKWPKMSVLWRAGRTFSRVSTRGPVAGRTFSRVIPRGPAVGRTCSRVKWGRGCTGPILSAYRHRDQASQVTRALHVGNAGGFALHEALWLRVIGVSDPRVVQIPPIGCGEAVA